MPTVPVAKAALITLFQALVWPGNQPEIRQGQPTEAEDAPFYGELVFLGETRLTTDFTQLGMHRRDEGFILRFVIDVTQEGDDELTVETRAWDLYEYAVNAIMANQTINDTVHHLVSIEANQVNAPYVQSWRTQIVVDLGVEAYAIP